MALHLVGYIRHFYMHFDDPSFANIIDAIGDHDEFLRYSTKRFPMLVTVVYTYDCRELEKSDFSGIIVDDTKWFP